MRNRALNIGLFGYGCVGKGFYTLVQAQPDLRISIPKICVKNVQKPRDIPRSIFTDDAAAILNDPNMNVVVELISDADAAYDIVRAALLAGKPVISANKKMLASHLSELVALQHSTNTPLLYEGAVCGSIPVIRNLENYYDKEPVKAIQGIINGSTNFILSSIYAEGAAYADALTIAQEKGFAEANPTLDVEAFDPAYKLCILLLHTFGLIVHPDAIYRFGISRLRAEDLAFAAKRNARIKLIAKAQHTENGITAYVLPHLVNGNSLLTHIEYETNAVVVDAAWSDTQLLSGKGAGSLPTGSAVLSDVTAIQHNYKYGYRKSNAGVQQQLTQDSSLRIYARAGEDATIDMRDFESVEEQYLSTGYAWVVGRINLKQLFSSSWIHNPSVGILVLD